MLEQHWQHLVRPLAPGVDDARAQHHRAFLYLKGDDSLLTIVQALERGWVRRLLGEAVVLNGSGAIAATEVGWRGAHGTSALAAIRQADAHLATNYTPHAGVCGIAEPGGGVPVRAAHARGASGVQIALGLAWCAAAIARHEQSTADSSARRARSSWRFSLVVFARPDQLFSSPIVAWCRWPSTTHGLACHAPGSDGFWAAPRDLASQIFGMREALAACAPGQPHLDPFQCAHGPAALSERMPTNCPGHHRSRLAAPLRPACCGENNEHLFARTLHRPRPLPIASNGGCAALFAQSISFSFLRVGGAAPCRVLSTSFAAASRGAHAHVWAKRHVDAVLATARLDPNTVKHLRRMFVMFDADVLSNRSHASAHAASSHASSHASGTAPLQTEAEAIAECETALRPLDAKYWEGDSPAGATSRASELEDALVEGPPRPPGKLDTAGVMRPRSTGEVHIVSFAHGSPFEASAHSLERLPRGRHGIHAVSTWNLSTFGSLPQVTTNAAAFAALQALAKPPLRPRPFCDAFKPAILVDVMGRAAEGRWILWADSSRYGTPQLGVDLRVAVARLEEKGLTATWGLSHCKGPIAGFETYPSNSDFPRSGRRHPRFVDSATFAAYATDTPECMHSEHVLATNVFVQNTGANRRHAAQWLQMALESPVGFCSSDTQDQAALALLVCRARLPRIHMCRAHPNRSSSSELTTIDQKKLSVFTATLAASAFDVVWPPSSLENESLRQY